MREVKFRVWLKTSKKMLLWDRILSDKAMIYRYFTWHDMYKLMQYIGEKDVNGKEIYEGDIVEFEDTSMEPGFDRPFIGKVRYNKGCFCIESEWGLHRLNSIDIEFKKVIGNIYENPELRGGKK